MWNYPDPWKKPIQSTQEHPLSEWDKYSDDLMTFTKNGILEKLEDGRRQTKRLPRLSPEN